ncbi:MAG: response regulator [Myxococcota bacterium]|nr:response regulator [Myxococcota bacterium]
MPKRILIVDDENYIRLLLKRTLEDFEFEGVEILLAEDGERGVELARKHHPDLIFLDLMMPKLDGVETCVAVRGIAGLEQTYIVLLTAKGQLPAFPDGARPDECLTKPFDPDQIVDIAQTVLRIDLDLE